MCFFNLACCAWEAICNTAAGLTLVMTEELFSWSHFDDD